MTDWIGRYIYAVVRHLPEKDRDEVTRELRANIADMLPDGADENEVKRVLNQMGRPSALSAQYRQSPGYLISPAVYDDYVHILKKVLPIVGAVLFAVGAGLGMLDAAKDPAASLAVMIGRMLSNGIGLGVSAAFQALVWTTAGFAIAERAGGEARSEWSVEKLPEMPPPQKYRISLAESLTGLLLTVVFSLAAIVVLRDKVPLWFSLVGNRLEPGQLFSDAFLSACVPAIAITALFSVLEHVARIKDRRWTLLVCVTTVASSVAEMGAALYLLTRQDIFSGAFLSYLQANEWGQRIANLLPQPTAGIVGALAIMIGLGECAHAVYRTVQSRSAQ